MLYDQCSSARGYLPRDSQVSAMSLPTPTTEITSPSSATGSQTIGPGNGIIPRAGNASKGGLPKSHNYSELYPLILHVKAQHVAQTVVSGQTLFRLQTT